MENKDTIETIKKLAEQVKEAAEKAAQEKTVKTAKFVVGLTALIRLRDKANKLLGRGE